MTHLRSTSAVRCLGAAFLVLASAFSWADRPVTPRLDAVGIVVPDTSNPYFSALLRAASMRVREANPKARLLVFASSYAPDKEAELLERLRSERLQVLIIAASGPSNNRHEFQQLRDDGVKLVAVDVEAPLADVTIQSDNRQAGADTCHALGVVMQGRGRLVIINGPQVSSVVERVAGCKSALLEYPNIQLLADDLDGLASPWGGTVAMERYLRRYPIIDAVFGINDPTTLGAVLAAKKVGRDLIYFGSVDGSVEAQAALKQPGRFMVTAAQDPDAIGRKAGDASIALVEGRYTGPTRVLLPTPLLTRAAPAQ